MFSAHVAVFFLFPQCLTVLGDGASPVAISIGMGPITRTSRLMETKTHQLGNRCPLGSLVRMWKSTGPEDVGGLF